MKKIFAVLILCVCLLCAGCGEKTTVINFSGNNPSPAAEKIPASTEKPVELDGEYEGRWEMFNCSGVWADFENYSWDCWAELKDKELLQESEGAGPAVFPNR